MENKFYTNGLQFKCTRCNNCCRFDPGYVFLSVEDVQRLCEGLGIDLPELTGKYLREVNISGFKRISLTEKENYDCIFWEEEGCKVYKIRPLQCRSYPFWPAAIADAKSWESCGKSCPGAGHGRVHTEEEIDEWQELRKKESFIDLP